MDYRQLAYQKALKYGLDPDLFLRQINQESGFNPSAVSSAGAIGLGQLMPNTARELGVDPTDPEQNLEGAARYMRQQMDRFGRTDLALAAYNAGPSRVAKANAIPNIAETQNYVSSILGSSPRISTKGSNMPMNKQKEEQGFDAKGALLSLASGLNALILPAARDQNAAGQLTEYQKQKEQARAANKTAAYFESIGRSDLAQLVLDRAISGRDAFSAYTQEQAAERSLEAQKEILALKNENATAKTYESDRQEAALISLGVDPEIARGIAYGKYQVSRDPQTGETIVVDVATQAAQMLTPSQTNVAPVEVDLPKSTQKFEGQEGAVGGVAGTAAKLANIVSGALGLGQIAPKSGELDEAMEDLSVRTVLGLTMDIEGKPTNQTREMVEKRTIRASDITTNPQNALNKATLLREELERSYNNAVTLSKSQTAPKSAKAKALAELEGGKLKSLLEDYISLENMLKQKVGGSSSSSQNVSDDINAIASQYITPN